MLLLVRGRGDVKHGLGGWAGAPTSATFGLGRERGHASDGIGHRPFRNLSLCPIEMQDGHAGSGIRGDLRVLAQSASARRGSSGSVGTRSNVSNRNRRLLWGGELTSLDHCVRDQFYSSSDLRSLRDSRSPSPSSSEPSTCARSRVEDGGLGD